MINHDGWSHGEYESRPKEMKNEKSTGVDSEEREALSWETLSKVGDRRAD